MTRRIVIVTGLSGAGKASVQNILEDLGYDAVDNLPVSMMESVVSGSERNLTIGVDARSGGFSATRVLATLGRLRADPGLRVEMVYLWADEATLLRRYTETRRRHPLSPQGRVADGIAAEISQTGSLREAADLAIDTSDRPASALRQMIEAHFGAASGTEAPSLVVSLISFAYPQGLPSEADLVFDARFLRNPHYDPVLRPHTGLDADVGAYITEDPDFTPFLTSLTAMLELLLPRFVTEGKKYVSIAIGCTGGRHRSVFLVESLAAHLSAVVARGSLGWRLHVTHRELAREGLAGAYQTDRSGPRWDIASNPNMAEKRHSDPSSTGTPASGVLAARAPQPHLSATPSTASETQPANQSNAAGAQEA